MEKEFKAPEIEIIKLNNDDIICTSGEIYECEGVGTVITDEESI